MNDEWALNQLNWIVTATAPAKDKPYWGGEPGKHVQMYEAVFEDDQILGDLPAVEAVLDQVVPGWRDRTTTDQAAPLLTRWTLHREAAQQARAILLMREEIEKNVGEAAPDLSASRLHRWVWDAAKSSWNAGFYTAAVSAALTRLNDETRQKGQRRDISEGPLFQQLFSVEDPKVGSPRLRLCKRDDNPDTFKSRHAGAANYALGLYMAVRNYLSHEIVELTEDEALEQLAAVSVLARWVDEATLETAP